MEIQETDVSLSNQEGAFPGKLMNSTMSSATHTFADKRK